MSHLRSPRPVLTKAQVVEERQKRLAAKTAKARKKKAKSRYVTLGGRHSNPEKLDWLRKQKCIVAENRNPWTVAALPTATGIRWAKQTPCVGRVEAHHHRVRGARANDARALPLCASHHRTAPDSLHVLGRGGFESFHRLSLDSECARYETEWAVARPRATGETQ